MHDIFKMRPLLPADGPGSADRVRPGAIAEEALRQRIRPILPTAAAASLALTPIARAVFRKPMAHATSGRVIVGAVLALQFLLALYVAWSGARAPDGARTA